MSEPTTFTDELDFVGERADPTAIEVVSWHTRQTAEQVRALRDDLKQLTDELRELRAQQARRSENSIRAWTQLHKTLSYILYGVGVLVATALIYGRH